MGLKDNWAYFLMRQKGHFSRNLLIGGTVAVAAVGGYLFFSYRSPSPAPVSGMPIPTPTPVTVAARPSPVPTLEAVVATATPAATLVPPTPTVPPPSTPTPAATPVLAPPIPAPTQVIPTPIPQATPIPPKLGEVLGSLGYVVRNDEYAKQPFVPVVQPTPSARRGIALATSTPVSLNPYVPLVQLLKEGNVVKGGSENLEGILQGGSERVELRGTTATVYVRADKIAYQTLLDTANASKLRSHMSSSLYKLSSLIMSGEDYKKIVNSTALSDQFVKELGPVTVKVRKNGVTSIQMFSGENLVAKLREIVRQNDVRDVYFTPKTGNVRLITGPDVDVDLVVAGDKQMNALNALYAPPKKSASLFGRSSELGFAPLAMQKDGVRYELIMPKEMLRG